MIYTSIYLPTGSTNVSNYGRYTVSEVLLELPDSAGIYFIYYCHTLWTVLFRILKRFFLGWDENRKSETESDFWNFSWFSMINWFFFPPCSSICLTMTQRHQSCLCFHSYHNSAWNSRQFHIYRQYKSVKCNISRRSLDSPYIMFSVYSPVLVTKTEFMLDLFTCTSCFQSRYFLDGGILEEQGSSCLGHIFGFSLSMIVSTVVQ